MANATAPNKIPTLKKHPLAVSDFPRRTFALGLDFGFAITKSGLFCWGFNDAGQLGLGHGPHQPVPCHHPLTGVISIFCLSHSTFAITTNGLLCWGENSHGQLGLGHKEDQHFPQKCPLKDVLTLSHGEDHVFALTPSGWYCWGQNEYGQLGLGHTNQVLTPQKFELDGLISIFCGLNHSFALTKNGLFSWGMNSRGQLGHGQLTTKEVYPKRVNIDEVLSVSSGLSHTFAQTRMGIYCWGSNFHGKIGIGKPEELILAPQEFHLDSIQSIWCGRNYTIAKTQDDVFGWGDNTFGQLGLGRKSHENEVESLRLEGLLSIYCSEDSTLALTRYGLLTWGANTSGKLGLGHSRAQLTPQRLNLPDVVFPISVGSGKSLEKLFDSKMLADFTIHGITVHRALIEIRCPELLEYDASKIPLEVLRPFLRFVYSNQLDRTLPSLLVTDILRLSQAVKFNALSIQCRGLLCSRAYLNDEPIHTACTNLWDEVQKRVMKLPLVQSATDWIYLPRAFQIVVSHFGSVITTLYSWTPSLSFSKPPDYSFSDLSLQKPIESDLDALFESGAHADFTLYFGSTVFYLHSFMLADWPFFAILKRSPRHDPKNGFPVETFRKILRYLYCGRMDTLTMEDAVRILTMREYYMLEPDCALVEYCCTLAEVNPSNWVRGYKLGLEIQEPLLVEQAALFASELLDPQLGEDVIQVLKEFHELEEKSKGQAKTIANMEAELLEARSSFINSCATK